MGQNTTGRGPSLLSWYIVFILLIPIALLVSILVAQLVPTFDKVPTTGSWLYLELIGILIEIGIGLVYFKLQKNDD